MNFLVEIGISFAEVAYGRLPVLSRSRVSTPWRDPLLIAEPRSVDPFCEGPVTTAATDTGRGIGSGAGRWVGYCTVGAVGDGSISLFA